MDNRKKRFSTLGLLLLILYAGILLYFVLFSDRLGRTDGYMEFRYNLTPFLEIRRFITYRDSLSLGALLLNLFGNVLVFSPFGFLIPMFRNEETSWYNILLFTFLFSLCIELTQLISMVGVFDVDDLILNTLGGMIGWGFYLLFSRAFESFSSRSGYGGAAWRMSGGGISFSEKRVSRNAVVSLVMGLGALLGFVTLLVMAIVTGGQLGLMAGLVGCLLLLAAVFGLFWGILSYDDVKTNQRFKIPGICVNIFVILLGIFLMMV